MFVRNYQLFFPLFSVLFDRYRGLESQDPIVLRLIFRLELLMFVLLFQCLCFLRFYYKQRYRDVVVHRRLFLFRDDYSDFFYPGSLVLLTIFGR